MTKIGAFCSPPNYLKKSTSIVVNGARVLKKIELIFCEKSQKTGKKSVMSSRK
jgi:hypothetical protein